MAKLRQFLLLLWKNYVLQKRRKLVTLVELSLPILLAVLLVFIRSLSPVDYHKNATTYAKFDIEYLPSQFGPKPLVTQLLENLFGTGTTDTKGLPIVYAPNTSLAVQSVMKSVVNKLGAENVTLMGFESEEQMENFLGVSAMNMIGGVIFVNAMDDEDFADSKNIVYKIRMKVKRANKNNPLALLDGWYTENIYPPFQWPGPRDKDSLYGGKPGYYHESFLTLQHAVAMGITEYVSHANTSKVQVSMQRFPYSPYTDNKFIMALQQWLSMVFMVSYLYPCVNLVKSLVHEKEQKLKESMKMMGLTGWLHWAAWFTKTFIFLIICTSAIVFLLCSRIIHKFAVLESSNPVIVMLFLIIYYISSISFCFLISAFFSKASSAATAGGLLWFLSYVPFFFIQQQYDLISWRTKIIWCLVSNTAMGIGGQVITMLEGTGAGVQWENIGKGVTPDDNFNLGWSMIMMSVDAVLYGLITWYVEAVFPGDYGIPEPWYFPITKTYWYGSNQSEDMGLGDLLPDTKQKTMPEYFEQDPKSLYAGIQIRNLSKVFKNKKVGVNKVNLNLYEGQITVLLGHNGAGKTTTLSMLTGLIPPSQGTALISNHDIRGDISGVRNSLGICPQHDVLFADLTVAEQLYFFAKLKGSKSEVVPYEINHMLKILQLEDKRNAITKTLSGGMKRKLSVGIALISDSKVVLLDEPTSGMDPAARRATWDLLQNERIGRTILLTTHFMDEADLLGDRIAIMAKGELQCSGTPLFLKKKYGAGYHMIIVKQRHCDVQRITNLVQNYIPSAELESNIGAELSFILPHEGLSKFEKLFSTLEGQKEALGISSYGASITTMEEVFLRVGEQEGGEGLKSMLQHSNSNSKLTQNIFSLNKGELPFSGNKIMINGCTDNMMMQEGWQLNQGLDLYMQQFWAMLVKRMLHTRRNWLLTLGQLIMPIIFLITALVVIKSLPSKGHPAPRVVDLSMFTWSEVPYFTLPGSESDQQIHDIAFVYSRQATSPNYAVSINNITSSGQKLNLEGYIIQESDKDLPRFNLHCIAAASFQRDENSKRVIATAHFNNQPYHGAAVSLGQLDSALFKYFTNNTAKGLTVINHPLPPNAADELKGNTNMNVGFSIAFNLVFGMAFLASSFVVFLIKERCTKARHLQFVSGVHCITFWASTFVWDFINYLLSCALIMLVVVTFGEDGYTVFPMQVRFVSVLLLYAWSMLPLMYIMSFMFEVPSTGFTRLTMFNIFSGVATILTVTILYIPDLDLEKWAHKMEWVFMVLPNYCLGWAFYDLHRNYEILKLCSSPMIKPFCDLSKFSKNCGPIPCPQYQDNYMAWESPGVGRMVIFLICQGFIFFFTIFLIEFKLLQRALKAIKLKLQYIIHPESRKVYIKLSQDPRINSDQDQGYIDGHADEQVEVDDHFLEDDDVATERDRVENVPLGRLMCTDNLVLRDLTKYYNKFLAVDHISVGIPRGECFGLLGVNGAGKTTTFKMLTGDAAISEGDAFVEGFSVLKHIKKVQQRVGYCPQFDAVIDQMTGRETLVMFARLRGVPEKFIPDLCINLADTLLLTEHLDKLTKDYSGGNRRKLSTALALVGSPPIVFLDEPTTGMDPLARRLLWDAISRVRDSGHSIILTSHSMEECDVLCTRLAIMVNGQFRCLGSPQHLKNKFGQGYTLIAKVRCGDDAPGSPPPLSCPAAKVGLEAVLHRLRAFIENSFPGSILKDMHQGMVHYHIQNPNLSWAYIFGTMEKARKEYGIEDYSVSQTSLEQVFLNFARTQRPTDVT